MARYPKWVFLLAVGLVVLHLNYWMWDSTRVVLGLPVNLLYHVVLSFSISLIMLVIVRRGWPDYLSED